MSQALRVDLGDPASSGAALDAAAAALAAGELVVLPTETVFGIAARPDLPGATARLFVAKRRPRGLNLPVLAATATAALDLAAPRPGAEALAARFWPGPLTLVLPRGPRSRPFDLGEDLDTVGLRVPGFAPALALLERAGPLAVTSANRSGEPPAADLAGLRDAFGDLVAVYLVPGGPWSGGAPSTVVDLTGPRARILRPGPVGARELAAALAGPGVEVDSVDFRV